MSSLDDVRLSMRDAASIVGLPTATFARLARSFALSQRTERRELGLGDDAASGNEVVRAAAWRHFRASGATKSGECREWLRLQKFEPGLWLMVLRRPDPRPFVIETARLLPVVTASGMYAVWDPYEVLRQLRLTFDFP